MYFSSTNPEVLLKWINNSEQDRAIAALQAIPEKRRTPIEQFLFGAAIMTKQVWLTPSRMEELRQGISIVCTLQKTLKKNSNQAQLNGQCDFLLGLGYFHLGEYQNAIPYFRKAPELNSKMTNQDMIDKCRMALDRPKDRKSFRTRTQRAWAAFTPEEASLRKMMNDAIQSPKVREKMEKKVYSLFSIAFRSVRWLWLEGDVPRITLQSSHSKCVALAAQYFLAHVPKELESRWEFIVGIPVPDEDDLIWMWEDGQYLCDMDIQVERNQDGMLRLTLYHASLKSEKPYYQDHERAYEMIYRNIGELVFLSLVRSVTISPTPLNGNTVKLGNLLSTLVNMGYVDRDDIQSLFLYRRPYTRTPQPHKPNVERRWRDDIVRGSSMDLTLCSLYEEELSEYSSPNLLAGSGAVPCFVVFPLKGQTDHPTALMQALLNELDTALDADHGVVLGEAEGLQFGYLDLLAFDLQPALDTAANVLRKHNIPWACWHSFFTTDRTVQLY